MLTLKHAKLFQGQLTLPPSADLFLVAAMTAVACRRKARIHPVGECPLLSRWTAALDSCAAVSREGDTVIVDPRPVGPSDAVVFPDDQLPYRDLVVFMALGRRCRVLFRNITEKRLTLWREQSQRIGFPADTVSDNGLQGLSPASGAPPVMPSVMQEQDINPALGLLSGMCSSHSFQIDSSLSTPLRDICAAFGCSITVQRDTGAEEKDPLIRRMRIRQRQRLSSQDQLFTVIADFTERTASGKGNGGAVDILLPGDEVLLALLLAAKSLIPKGTLTIDNAPLETWALPVMTLMRKMGAKPAQQETHRSAFGAAGVIALQKFDLTGQKTDFVPHFHYTFHLPAMTVLAAFAEGQSLFRRFEDLRRSDPDGIRQLETCLRAMRVKFGDIPDGFVVKGSREHDGFDLIEPLPAPLAGAFAVAGLHCIGSTTVNDELLCERWPDFSGLIEKHFE